MHERSVPTGHTDSSVVWPERIVSDQRDLECEITYRGALVSAAHQRLVLLNARTGRPAGAERCLAVLERWWDRTDGVTRPVLEAARTAVKGARAWLTRRVDVEHLAAKQ